MRRRAPVLTGLLLVIVLGVTGRLFDGGRPLSWRRRSVLRLSCRRGRFWPEFGDADVYRPR
ncbi:hypothetical protein [Amycolatopsis sp. EV170708-02-1]|uniref:hypothetical protein n=1 Tax=Amycolatopsis sp. EV170708-02-1 TaxID=2919322 RepID=UPI001F0BD969|nr:hypothetical protein [Amycolatopsis sp. EV170708-02-1]UMP03731.1 hypothetical protein MJQ72_02270 [Amycolatopsis sp. EV170708-02-1]